jgi:DNA repair exonuclease SbcCD ATPase subunit
MRTFKSLTVLAGVTLLSVPALANNHLRAISDRARTLQSHAQEINIGLKKKSLTTEDLKAKLDQSAATLDQLKSTLEQLENASPSLATMGRDWQLLKDKVQLLAIFHDRKSELLTDVNRNRGMIRAHADGIAKRAAMLQETVNRLQKNMPSTSNSSGSTE